MSKKQAKYNSEIPAHKKWVSDNGYEKAAKKLKNAGLINWDLRKKLSPQKKAAITRMAKDVDVRGYAEYATALKNPNFPNAEKYMTSPKVTQARAINYFNRLEKHSDVSTLYPYEKIKVSKKEAAILRKKGIHTHHGYALVRKDKLSTIRKEKVLKPDGTYEIAFVQRSKNGTEIHLYAFSKGDFLEQLENFKNIQLPIHQRLMVTYGLRHPEHPTTYANYTELNKYVYEALYRGNGKNHKLKSRTLAEEIERFPELQQLLGIETIDLF